MDYRKAEDISDEIMLDAIREAAERTRTPSGWTFRWDIESILAGQSHHVHPWDFVGEYPCVDRDTDYPGVPSKVVLAKLRRLCRRGIIDGCPCGCRGDFVIK